MPEAFLSRSLGGEVCFICHLRGNHGLDNCLIRSDSLGYRGPSQSSSHISSPKPAIAQQRRRQEDAAVSTGGAKDDPDKDSLETFS